MPSADTDQLVRRFIAGDPAAAAHLVDLARTSDEPLLLATAALVDPAPASLLARAARSAAAPRDRQLVALVAAHLDGDADRVDALARDHLVDYPDSLLVAWLAAMSSAAPAPSAPKENR